MKAPPRPVKSLLAYVLLIAAVVSLLLGGIEDFVIVASLLAVNNMLGYWQELKAESSIRALRRLVGSKVKVPRGGSLVEAPSSKLVPGDVVVLCEGDVVTADIRLFDSSELMVG